MEGKIGGHISTCHESPYRGVHKLFYGIQANSKSGWNDGFSTSKAMYPESSNNEQRDHCHRIKGRVQALVNLSAKLLPKRETSLSS